MLSAIQLKKNTKKLYFLLVRMHLFIFRRDLRLTDNLALHQISDQPVTPVFIFNPKQIERSRNRYFGDASVQFMIETLEELHHECHALKFLYGHDLDLLKAIHKHTPIESVAFNRDYTPFARQRDDAILEWCTGQGIKCLTTYQDYSLLDPSSMDKPYQVFTPYYKRFLASNNPSKPVQIKPRFTPLPTKGLSKESILSPTQLRSLYKENPQIAVRGGRSRGRAILKRIERGVYQKYDKTRDDISNENGTTKLSAYLKYGCISIREAYHAVVHKYGKQHGLIRELYWRAFYDQIVYHFPHTLEGKSLRPKYDKIQWENNPRHIKSWKEGRTGFPIVDAGIRQMLQTGYMHNRVRMIVGSFLVKDLHCDWRIGEHFFAQHLVDYYPSANNGGWQWCSGSGADAQQYNRIFNPWLQTLKFDPECTYIKRWVPELRELNNQQILHWDTESAMSPDAPYPNPIIDHKLAVQKTKVLYKRALY